MVGRTGPREQRRNGRGGNRIASAALVPLSLVCLCTGALIAESIVSAGTAYEDLALETIRDADADESDADRAGAVDADAGDQGEGDAQDVDWGALLGINADTVAWLSVEGTSIDHPVVQPADGVDADWYLTHSFWGEPSSAGCLYLDARAGADGTHQLVCGHHLGWTDQMFSEIFQTYEQEVFDTVGQARWSTPEGGTTVYEPVMALSVDKTYAAIQQFEFEDAEALRAWLMEIEAEATARADDAETLIDGATRVLTLVTCSSVTGGQRARTLLVFVT